MNLDIAITKRDIGPHHHQVKSLLRKFQRIEENKEALKKLTISLELEGEEYHELSGAVIWRLARHYQDLPCEKILASAPEIQEVLKKRRFYDGLFGSRSTESNINVPIDFEAFTPRRHNEPGWKGARAEEIYKAAMGNMLDAANEFQGEVYSNVLEILNNVFDHSEHSSEAGIVCAKADNSNRLSVCAVDMGQGIRASLLSNPALREEYESMSDHDLLREVMKHRVSCNPSFAKHPNYQYTNNGGIGLYYLSLMAKMHKGGQLILISDGGYYYLDSHKKEVRRRLGDLTWPGTIVFFRIDLDQEINPIYREYVQNI
ncbi:MAG: hypothetical protein KBD06_03965 [Candidatus Pacebacteria bacterium]|nr:hypothetical protein [Candidatus Paceibacterota bacterium]